MIFGARLSERGGYLIKKASVFWALAFLVFKLLIETAGDYRFEN